MAAVTGIDGKPRLQIDQSKVTPSKLNCLESGEIQRLIELWAVGDVDNADVQTWLMFQMLVQLTAANMGGRIVRPS